LCTPYTTVTVERRVAMRKATERKVGDFFTAQADILGVLKALQERLNALERAHDGLRDSIEGLWDEVRELRELLEGGVLG